MMIAIMSVYLALLFGLVWLGIIRFNTFWKVSPIILLIILNLGLFIPMGWGAPQGPVVVVRNSVAIVPDVAGEVVDVPVVANTPLKAGDVLFKIDPTPYDAQVKAIEAQLKLSTTRLAQMTQLFERDSGRGFDSSSGNPRSINSPRSFRARSGTWTRLSCARRPTAMSPTSRCARARGSETCRCRRRWPSSTRRTP